MYFEEFEMDNGGIRILWTYNRQSLQLPWTLKVRPLAVFRSFSSFSGLALRKTWRKSAVRLRIRECINAFANISKILG